MMRPLFFLTALALTLAGCKDGDAPVDSGVDDSAGFPDADGDGYTTEEDCDDADPFVNPGAEEVCDDKDNNCDGSVDEGVTTTFYGDNDGDGYGADDATTEACGAPEGYAAIGGDCNDGDAAYNPGASEADCTDPNDYNCDGSVGYADNDGDGFPACEECNDADPAVNPDAAEVCDGLDNDCDGDVDDADSSLDTSTATTWYGDYDNDGYGDDSLTQLACEQPGSTSDQGGDCDDSDAAIHPAAQEICDGVDNDCDTLVDDDDDSVDTSTGATFYADADADGYGDAAATTQACGAPEGYGADSSDCDDSDAAVNPAAQEVCNDVDDDCDGDIDDDDASLDASTGATFYADSDGDSYGDPSASLQACDPPSGAVSDSSDCDDSDSAVNPAAQEICNNIDDDCDGATDDADASLDTSTGATWYADSDADGYGDASASQDACSAPSGYVSDDSDCDDAASTTNPGASELCDGVDNDCDGAADDGVLGSGQSCSADDCAAILADQSSASDGLYWLNGATNGDFEAWCDMSTDGGGWTLIGSVVNEYHTQGANNRSWGSYAVWTDTTTFGSISGSDTTDYKGEGFVDTTGDDFLVITDEYEFAFYNVLGGASLATFIIGEYDSNTCSTNYLASGADYYDQLSAEQAAAHSFIVRPLDSNASCFPGANENAMLGIQMADCCWTNGIGNCPTCQSSWQTHDLSLLNLSRLNVGTCTAGTYPCNDNGRYFTRSQHCYGPECKVDYAELYVR
ncbi:MAG: hypothetical protein H6740_24710 [Alphaproteobacteria bacterium]|nr:hypothetical protein [Alphaproteobacteria bacterium]